VDGEPVLKHRERFVEEVIPRLVHVVHDGIDELLGLLRRRAVIDRVDAPLNLAHDAANSEQKAGNYRRIVAHLAVDAHRSRRTAELRQVLVADVAAGLAQAGRAEA
jgi:hypothetical protein